MRCPHCGGQIDGVVRWTELNDDYARAVREDATVTAGDDETFREQTADAPNDGDYIGRAEVGER